MSLVETTCICEGSCEEHKGKVKEIYVKDWGHFYYCEEAIEEDRRRGLIVTEPEE